MLGGSSKLWKHRRSATKQIVNQSCYKKLSEEVERACAGVSNDMLGITYDYVSLS